MSRLSIISKVLLAGVFIAAVFGCGGTTTNNDQGTSFLAFGYFQDTEGETGSSGALVVLSPEDPIQVATAGVTTQLVDGNQVLVTIGLQNRLVNQFIRVVRIDCSYNIPGADPGLSIPDDSFNTAFVIAADSTGIDSDTGELVPGGAVAGVGSVHYTEFQVVSPDIISYINVNRNSLPELPFRMNVTCRAVGVTQAGDTVATNDLVYFVNFFDKAECCTGSNFEGDGDLGFADGSVGQSGGFQSGAGSGGGIVFTDGSTSTGAATSGATAAGSLSSSTGGTTS